MADIRVYEAGVAGAILFADAALAPAPDGVEQVLRGILYLAGGLLTLVMLLEKLRGLPRREPFEPAARRDFADLEKRVCRLERKVANEQEEQK